MAYLKGLFYSLPVQLVFLHFRKYQLLVLFWMLLFLIAAGGFMKSFGADALFLAPEYLGNVNFVSTALVGMAIGVFIMCWNVTTFILFSRHFTFLAATQYPFLKYCINNSIIPLSFLFFYLVKTYQFAYVKELMSTIDIIILIGGFLVGLFLTLTISFLYFFGADKSIFKKLQPLFANASGLLAQLEPGHGHVKPTGVLIHPEYFLDSFLRVRRCRDVSHYAQDTIDKIFKRHHFAAVVSVLIAYLFLIVVGFFMDYKAFQIPAAASIVILLAILIGISGAITYFLQSWSIPVLIVFMLVLNLLFQFHFIDPTNKAYGLNYSKEARPTYTAESLQVQSSQQNIEQDKKNMEAILTRWKEKQQSAKPLLMVLTTSGGGTRSATFTLNVMQQLDSLTGGTLMNKTFLITGASGGMIGASYFRELYRQKLINPAMRLQDQKYVDAISKDLLNPTFSSFVARDIFAPEQKFSVGPYTYLRDRGYSFESALDDNTRGILNKKLIDYKSDETAANIPLMLYHTVVTRDGKKMLISTQPMRFMTQPATDSSIAKAAPDAIDFATFFKAQDPYNLRMLTILRMQATFPVVLPNVWLPSDPIIDVMDGGLRDNYGLDNSLRFLTAMKDWIAANTSGVVVVQIRDRMDGGWENPLESSTITENATKPFFLLQHNWYKMMEYAQNDMFSYFTNNSLFPVHNVVFQYVPSKEENKAALSFHLSQREKRDIAASLKSEQNDAGFKKLEELLQTRPTDKLAGSFLSVVAH
ncbi:MAG TPA: patatin-like phospholipase family protein [Chitinophagaceae bacterium]|nr:patatin-like phospholipase family protein [Chitinophagaceae bacterium]